MERKNEIVFLRLRKNLVFFCRELFSRLLNLELLTFDTLLDFFCLRFVSACETFGLVMCYWLWKNICERLTKIWQTRGVARHSYSGAPLFYPLLFGVLINGEGNIFLKTINKEAQIKGEGRILIKGQLNSEWIFEVIVSPKMQTKNLRISALPNKQGL